MIVQPTYVALHGITVWLGLIIDKVPIRTETVIRGTETGKHSSVSCLFECASIIRLVVTHVSFVRQLICRIDGTSTRSL